MDKKAINILAGFASVLSIMPNTDYSRFAPEGNAQSRIRGHFERVGGYLNNANAKVIREQEKNKQAA